MYAKEEQQEALEEFRLAVGELAAAEKLVFLRKAKLKEAQAYAVHTSNIGRAKNEMLREKGLLHLTIAEEFSLNEAEGKRAEAHAMYELAKYQLDLMLAYGARTL